MRMIALLMFLVATWSGAAFSEEWTEAQKVIVPACEEYLRCFSCPKELEGWIKKTLSRADDIVKDGRASDRDEAVRAIALDWAWDNEDKLGRKEPKAVKAACFFFLLFKRYSIVPPQALRIRFGVEEATKLAKELTVMAGLAQNY